MFPRFALVCLFGLTSAAAAQHMAASAALNTVSDPVDPAILGSCPPSVHDRYYVIAGDNKPYRTWHPQTVPVDAAKPGAGSCTFAHEHGDDPRTSRANSSLPAFGYVAALAGMAEPNEGFKVYVVNQGAVNDEGRDAKVSTRLILHMGTGGPARFSAQFHTVHFDLVAGDGHYVHVRGLADTKKAGSICQRDAALRDSDPTNDIGRSVVVTRGSGCDVNSLYEIWASQLDVGGRATIIASTAAFDPITILNPAAPSQLIFTNRDYPGQYHGCNREAYHGPVYWYNRNGPTAFQTDPYGKPVTSGGLTQQVSRHNDIGIPMSPDQTQFKLRSYQCRTGLGFLN
jgi:hypothetical protein